MGLDRGMLSIGKAVGVFDVFGRLEEFMREVGNKNAWTPAALWRPVWSVWSEGQAHA